MASEAKIVVLGTADWNQPIATNQHYVTRELAAAEEVVFIESIGLRRPEVSLRDLRRVARRLGVGVGGQADLQRPRPTTVTVRSPRLIPLHVAATRRFNTRALDALAPELSAPGSLLWTYTPLTYGLAGRATHTVYHCVDILGAIPGIDRDLIEREERRLAANGAIAIGTSPAVMDHLRAVGFVNPLYWPNVADVQVFASQAGGSSKTREGAVFAGNLTELKVDFALLRACLNAGIRVQLAGPIAEGGGDARGSVQSLVDLGADYRGPLSLDGLAELFACCRVGLIPYLKNDYTVGVSPLKTFEYLAAGLAVVSTELPGVRPIDGDVVLAGSPDEFVAAVRALLSDTSPLDGTRRLAEAEAHSWALRGEEIRALVRELR